MNDVEREALGQSAYAAYALSTGGKTYDGRANLHLPLWDDMPETIREAWRCAASTAAATWDEIRGPQ